MLIDDVRIVLSDLANNGWSDVFSEHGLDITADNLAEELVRPLEGIDRGIPGFGDLSPDCSAAVTPGDPASSLLYHGLARPQIGGGSVQRFPTLAEIDVIENYIYATAERSLAQVRNMALELTGKWGGNPSNEVAIVLMASEYRPALTTVHGLHADFVYSRTGIARSGTHEAHYKGAARGFWPASDGQGIHVIPCVWNAYLCARVAASPSSITDAAAFGPLGSSPIDHGKHFWVPLHKLFAGSECLSEVSLELDYTCHTESTKIARIHTFLDAVGEDSHIGNADLSQAPYRLTEGLAAMQLNNGLPPGSVVPIPGPLVEAARDSAGALVHFAVPRHKRHGSGSTISHLMSSLELRTGRGSRSVPEYVHIRHMIDSAGNIVDLNDNPDMMQTINAAGYEALHYVDKCGAGFVSVNVSGLEEEIDIYPGFSIVAAPDFYPMVDQQSVQAWGSKFSQDNPMIGRHIAWGAPPDPLSKQRIVADPQLSDGTLLPFANVLENTADTITAVIAGARPRRSTGNLNIASSENIERCPVLPDSAAGVFAPGWAVSVDRNNGVDHLAAYGLGSPFPEDAKLCAALSAFWPAAAPDTTRTYQPQGDSIAPMLDAELAFGTPWDGIDGVQFDEERDRADFPDPLFSDYINSALDGKFDIRRTAKVDFAEYTGRVQRTAEVREWVGREANFRSREFALLSFSKVEATGAIAQAISNDTGQQLTGLAYRFIIGTLRRSRRVAGNHHRRVATAELTIELVADSAGVFEKVQGHWQR